jgi:hypothetical protein
MVSCRKVAVAVVALAASCLGVTVSAAGASAAEAGPYAAAGLFRADGVLASAPATVDQPSLGQAVFVVGTDDHVWWATDHMDWTSLGAPPVGIVGDPAAVSWGDDRIDLFVRGGDNRLWQDWTDCGGCQWSGWLKPLGNNGTLASSPTATSWGVGRIDVFVLGTNGLVYQVFWETTTWNGSWLARGRPPSGIADSRPGAASAGLNQVDLFVQGADNRLWQSFWTGTVWTGWFQPPGTASGVLASAPSPAPWGEGLLLPGPRLTVFVRGTDGRAYQTTWDGGWSPWTALGIPQNVMVGAPGVVTSLQEQPEVVVRGTDNRCYAFAVSDPLAGRAAAMSNWAAGRAGMAGFTLVDLATGEMYQGGYANAQIRTASVIKVPIAMALLAMVDAQGRTLTPAELSALQLMITQSDNNSATALWNEVGGASVIGLMRTLGATDTAPDPGGAWGFTLTTSHDLAIVLARLAQGVLGPSATDLIISLMRQVIPAEAWGIGAAIPGAAIKNGWYPDPGDWRVNCLGIAGGRTYALAIMTEYPIALGEGYGEATCQEIASGLLGGVGPADSVHQGSRGLVVISGRGTTADGG